MFSNHELCTTPDRSTRHVEIQFPGSISYSAGDHLGLFGANPDEVVIDYLDHLNVAHDAVVRVELEAGRSMSLVPLGKVLGAYQVLAWFFELQGVATRVQLRALSKLAADKQERLRLVELSAWSECGGEIDAYEEHIRSKRRTVLEILKEFKSVQLSMGQLMGILPANKPRYYSISCSPRVSPGSVSVTVSVVSGISPTGRRHLGCCSNFLRDQPRQLPTSVHPSHTMMVCAYVKRTGAMFQLPDSADTPIIMIGPGTGVAPMRGFIQDRVACGATENVLFFGCRDEGEHIYRNELEAWQRDGWLELHVAFSRMAGKPRQYVQDHVECQGARVVELVRRGAHIYVCGDASKMAPDVKSTFSRLFVRAGLGEGFVDEMVERGLYCQDVWAAQSV